MDDEGRGTKQKRLKHRARVTRREMFGDGAVVEMRAMPSWYFGVDGIDGRFE